MALSDGTQDSFLTAEEKRIDVRIALDVIAFAHRNEYEVALVFSQDQDLSEAAEEIRAIARELRMVDQDRECLPPQPRSREPQGDQQDRLDQDRPSAVRPVSRPTGLPEAT
ncbi:MAG: NYN domain-containing protein [Gammaproteobacteria bacterium]|nr:NYN domain-containing protein [Gammaproteobacteria bacterium]MDE0249204.1 NYN domain-containing protein [Gammaproteobacteria bacterium]